MIEQIRTFWDKLSPKSQRQFILFFSCAIGLSMLSLMVALVPTPHKLASGPKLPRHLLTDADPRNLGIESLSASLRELQQKNERLEKTLKEWESRAQQKPGEGSLSPQAQERINVAESAIKALTEQLDQLRQNQNPPTPKPDVPGPAERIVQGKPMELPDTLDIDHLFEQAHTGPRPLGNQTGIKGEIRVIRNSDTPEIKTPNLKGRTEGFFLPAGALIAGALLNGLDVPTGKTAKKEPYPVLVRIQEDTLLPNHFSADLKECFLIASGYGDLAAERAYIRAETLSCVKSNADVIEVGLEAYAVGEDGKLGLRGTVVSKQGQLMAEAMLAGFTRGFADLFGRTPVPTLLTGTLGSSVGSMPTQSHFNEGAVEGGALKGAGFAMDRLAHYYMDLAENLFPVIEIDATRKIEFILQRGLTLKPGADRKKT